MKIRIQIGLEHGVLFLFDPHAEPEIPLDAGAATVTSTETCIAFQALHYVDGEADVTISDAPFSGDAKSSYDKRILCLSKSVAVIDDNGNRLSVLSVVDKYADVKIWYYEDLSVWIQIVNLYVF